MRRGSIILLCVFLLSAISAFAQGLGSIVGTVVDPSGAAIGSAKVTATQAGTNFSRIAISNADGSFVLSSLNPAAYVLTIEASGFRLEKQNVTLLAVMPYCGRCPNAGNGGERSRSKRGSHCRPRVETHSGLSNRLS